MYCSTLPGHVDKIHEHHNNKIHHYDWQYSLKKGKLNVNYDLCTAILG